MSQLAHKLCSRSYVCGMDLQLQGVMGDGLLLGPLQSVQNLVKKMMLDGHRPPRLSDVGVPLEVVGVMSQE